MRRVGARGLQRESAFVVGPVPSPGDWACAAWGHAAYSGSLHSLQARRPHRATGHAPRGGTRPAAGVCIRCRPGALTGRLGMRRVGARGPQRESAFVVGPVPSPGDWACAAWGHAAYSGSLHSLQARCPHRATGYAPRGDTRRAAGVCIRCRPGALTGRLGLCRVGARGLQRESAFVVGPVPSPGDWACAAWGHAAYSGSLHSLQARRPHRAT